MAASKSNLVALATLSLLFASCAADYSTPTGGYAGGYSQSLANGQVAEGSTAAWTQAEGLDDANAYALLTAYAMTDNPFGDAEALSVSGAESLIDQDTEGPPVYAGVIQYVDTEQYGNGIALAESDASAETFSSVYKHYVPPIPCYGKNCWYPEPEPAPEPTPAPEPCDSWWC